MAMSWQYIAGFFDGEGSISRRTPRNGYAITIPQTELNVLNEIRSFVCFGSIYAVAKKHEHWKDNWVYNRHAQREVLHFCESVAPFLVIKRDKIVAAANDLWELILRDSLRKQKRDEDIAFAVAMREQGHSYREIASALGSSNRLYARSLLRSGGVVPRY